jgi:hypothetical protein
VFALGLPALLPTANGAASRVTMTQSCFFSSIEGRFRWNGNDVQAKQQWLDLSTFDNRFVPGTYQSEGPFRGITNGYDWLDLAPNTIYYFRVTQELRDGTWEASGTFTATTTACEDIGIQFAFDNNSRETMAALAASLPPTTPAPGRVLGFSTKPVKDAKELTPPNGTISGACREGLLYAVVQVPAPTLQSAITTTAGGEWSINGVKSVWRFTLGAASKGGVIRVMTLTFDESLKVVPGVYEVRYGTGANAIEGKVTLAC